MTEKDSLQITIDGVAKSAVEVAEILQNFNYFIVKNNHVFNIYTSTRYMTQPQAKRSGAIDDSVRLGGINCIHFHQQFNLASKRNI